jgi:hypothetical protein
MIRIRRGQCRGTDPSAATLERQGGAGRAERNRGNVRSSPPPDGDSLSRLPGKNQYGDNRALLGDQMAATPALAALASSNAVGGVLSALLSSP